MIADCVCGDITNQRSKVNVSGVTWVAKEGWDKRLIVLGFFHFI